MRPPILHKRGVLPVLFLLALVLVGTGMQIAFGSAPVDSPRCAGAGVSSIPT